MKPLDFDQLRAANVRRCEDAFHPLDAWSITDWACAAAGEIGEACNVAKKIRRVEIGSGFRRPEEIPDQLRCDLGDEIADAVIYLDLLAARIGLDLGNIVANKFNATSERVGSEVVL